MALRYLANPGFQSGIAREFGIHQTTVSKTAWQVVQNVCSQSQEWVTWPTRSQQQLQEAKSNWYEKFEYPSAIGAIDCTHIRIEKPSGAIGNEYVNRKGYASINVQATCDEKHRFTSVDASWPGSVHDNRIFKNSEIHVDLSNRQGVVLLGDEGYGIAPFVMKPFANPNSPQEVHFNRIHSKARVVIENAFGQLKRRFPILKYMIRVKLERVPTYIIACCVLHNVAKELRDTATEDEQIDLDDDAGENVRGDAAEFGDAQRRAAGQQRRQEIAEIMFRRRHGNLRAPQY